MQQALQVYPTSELVSTFSQQEIIRILQMIESIRPEEITRPDQLVQVGPYSFAQIRMAIAQQAIEWVDYRPAKEIGQGKTARLYVRYPSSGGHFPKTVKLEISDSRCFVLEFEFPILEPKDSWEATLIRYADFRSNKRRITFLSQMQKGATLEDTQHMWSGLRFLCCNLRKWEQTDITYPEDV